MGHVKPDCRKYKAFQEKQRENSPKRTKVRATTVEEDSDEEDANEVPPIHDAESLMVYVKKLKVEDQVDLTDRLLVQADQDF
jgi:SepF-like predicted cell division protein (DUF552 family)